MRIIIIIIIINHPTVAFTTSQVSLYHAVRNQHHTVFKNLTPTINMT